MFFVIYLRFFAQSEQAIALQTKTKNCWARENCFKQNMQRIHVKLSMKLRGGDIIVDIFISSRKR